MPTPYERIDVLEAALRELVARVERLEKGVVYGTAPVPDKTVPGSTLHLPNKAKH